MHRKKTIRRYIPLILIFIVALSSCATQTARKYPLPFSVVEQSSGPLFTLSLTETQIRDAGFETGDWIILRLEKQEVAARLATERSASYPTLVAAENESFLYVPEAHSGELIFFKELQKQPSTSLHLSGTFVFTF